MKKIILIIISMVIFYVLIGNVASIAIPEDALRIRVIANSNSEYDQKIKTEVRSTIQYKVYELLKDTKGIVEARKVINNNLNFIDKEVDRVLKNNNYDYKYTINYGLNYFPSKEYKGITYDEGYYESLVITIGEGLGDNWWCVLFPPLCLIEAEESTQVEYTSYVKELIEKYM